MPKSVSKKQLSSHSMMAGQNDLFLILSGMLRIPESKQTTTLPLVLAQHYYQIINDGILKMSIQIIAQ